MKVDVEKCNFKLSKVCIAESKKVFTLSSLLDCCSSQRSRWSFNILKCGSPARRCDGFYQRFFLVMIAHMNLLASGTMLHAFLDLFVLC